MRSSGLSSWTPILSVLIRRRKDTEKEKHRAESDVKMDAEMGMMCLLTTETWQRGMERILSQNL